MALALGAPFISDETNGGVNPNRGGRITIGNVIRFPEDDLNAVSGYHDNVNANRHSINFEDGKGQNPMIFPWFAKDGKRPWWKEDGSMEW